MNLATAFTDLHTHNYKLFDNNGSRLENCLKVIDDVYAFNLKNNINFILFGGDIVDQQQAVPTVAGNALMQRMAHWIEKHPHIVWFAITGNHDQATRSLYGSPGSSFLTQLEICFPMNFVVLDDKNKTFTGGEVQTTVHGIPYYAHPEHYHKALADRVYGAKHLKGKHILMIHQTPGPLPNPNIPVDTNVHDELYDAFDLVICGHIHTGMELTRKFHLLGSPLHQNLGDEGDEKGFWVLDLEDPVETLTFVSRKGRYPEFRRIAADDSEEFYPGDYVIKEIVSKETVAEIGDANLEDFSSSLTSEQLVENYWKEVEGSDKALLKAGLAFLK